MKCQNVIMAFAVTFLSWFACAPSRASDDDWGYDYSTNDLTATITRYYGTASSVTIPSSFSKRLNTGKKDEDGEYIYKTYTFTVTAITNNAFARNSNLVSVSIPSTITTLSGFAYCTNLVSISCSAPPKVIDQIAFSHCYRLRTGIDLSQCRSIGLQAFMECHSLELGDLRLPCATNIGAMAFHKCHGITSVELFSDLKALQGGAFDSCYGLVSAHIDGDHLALSGVVASCSNLLQVTIGDGVVSMGYSASSSYSPFGGCNRLRTLVVGTGITSISNSLCKGLPSLETATFHGDIQHVGDSAFYNCTNLVSLSLGGAPKTIGQNAFGYCRRLESGIDLTRCTSIEPWAFSYCESLPSLAFSDCLTNISYHAFTGCSGLTDIVLPSSLTSLGSSAFIYCTGLKSASVNGTGVELQGTFRGCTNLENLTLGNGVTNITSGSSSAFGGCSNLTTLVVGTGVTVVSNYLCRNLPRLRTVVLHGKISEIGNSAFSGCTNLSSLSLGAPPNAIGNSAFDNCKSLRGDLDLSQCESIGGWAFSGCTAYDFGDLALPSVKTIGSSAFSSCPGLRSINTPASLTSLGELAFSGCTGLKNATVNGTGLELSWKSFSGCTNLESVTLGNGITNITAGSSASSGSPFVGCSNLTTLAVGTGVTAVPKYLCRNLPRLQTVDMHGAVSEIGEYAFSGCTNLASLSLGAAPKTIGSSAFDNCKSLLGDIDFSLCESIGGSAFHNCAAWEARDLALPKITSVNGSTFYGCNGMTGVRFSEGLTNIGGSAFQNCANLSNVWFAGGVPTVGSNPFRGVADGAWGYYEAEDADEWEKDGVIGADGKWQGLIMKLQEELAPPELQVESADPMKRSIKLAWRDPGAVSGVTYSVYRGATGERAAAELVAPSVTGNTWTDNNFWTAEPALKPLNYWVVANDSGGGKRESEPLKTRRRFGVFVGLSEFDPALKTEPLPAPAKEAVKLRDLFVQHGEMDASNAVSLTNYKAKWEDVRRELRAKVLDTLPGDLFVFYIATHGVTPPTGAQNQMGLEFYDKKNIFFGKVFEELGKFNPGVVVIPIFGTCHSGVFTDYATGVTVQETSRIFKQFVEAGLGMCRANMPVLAACGSEETSPAQGTDKTYTGFGESFIFQGWENGYADGEVSGVGYERKPGDGCEDGYVSFLELIRYAMAFSRGFSDNKRCHVQWSAEPLEYEWLLRDTLAGRVPTGGSRSGVPETPVVTSATLLPLGEEMGVYIEGNSVANATRYWCYVLKEGKPVNSENEDDWECVCYFGQQDKDDTSLFWGWHAAVVLGKTDRYRVRAVNGAGASGFSNIVELNDGETMESVDMVVHGPGNLVFRWKAVNEGEGGGGGEAVFLVDDSYRLGLDSAGTWKTERLPFRRNGDYRLRWVRTGGLPVRVELLKWTATQSAAMGGSIWQYTDDGGESTVMGGEIEDHVEIPAELGGVAVTAIGEGAFFGEASLMSVLIPNSVNNIGDGAFAGCSGLASMTIPASVAIMGSQVFEGCSNLATLYVPAAWEGTDMLEGAEVPEGCAVIYGGVVQQTVRFDANGGTCKKASVTCPVGGKYSGFPTATWENHVFQGWYDDPEGGTRVRIGMEVTAAAERTLYAHWERQTVHFDATGGQSKKESVTCYVGGTYSGFPACTWENHVFQGWYDDPEGGTRVKNGMPVTAETERTLYAHWKRQTVRFDANGGTCKKKSVTCYVGGTYTTLASASWDGRKFLGWYDAPTGGNRVKLGMEVTADAERTLYAHWEQTIRFDGNGGTIKKASVTCVIGETYTTLASAKWDGRKFLGWYDAPTGGNRVKLGMEVTADAERTLYAHWEQTVRFDGNGGTCSKTTATYVIGGTYSGFKTATRNGFAFKGWYTAKEGGARVKNGMTVTEDAERTLYAHWQTTAAALSITGFSRSFRSGATARDARVPATECTLRVETIADAVYEVQWTPALGGEWTVLKRWTADADSETAVSVSVPAGEATGFFRVREVAD